MCVCVLVQGRPLPSSLRFPFSSSQCLFSGRHLDKALTAHQPYKHLNNGTWCEAALQVHSRCTSFFSSRPSLLHLWAFALAVQPCSLSGSSALSFRSQVTYHLFRETFLNLPPGNKAPQVLSAFFIALTTICNDLFVCLLIVSSLAL